jgi:hypothetical protein
MAYLIPRRPVLVVTSQGSEIPGVKLNCEGEYGVEKPSAKATVHLTRLPSWISNWSQITIAAGATDAGVRVRFTGEVYDFPRYTLGPRDVVLDCRGYLWRTSIAPDPEDTDDPDVPGRDLSNMTAREQIMAVLDERGLSSHYAAADIGGTTDVLGTQTADDSQGSKNPHIAKRNKPLYGFIKDRDKVELGFRLMEHLTSTGIKIIRPQISPRPSGTAAVTLEEGISLDRQSTFGHSSPEQTFDYQAVTGYDSGSGPVKAIATSAHPFPVPGVSRVPAPPISSQLIEKATRSDPGEGWCADEVAAWALSEVNERMLLGELITPLDDLINLQDPIDVTAPDRLEVAQTFWTRSVNWSIRDGWKQRVSVRAPAAIGRGGSILPISIGQGATLGFGFGFN